MTETEALHESRARILQAIERSAAPLPVETIADQTGLHANTIRGHLDVLIASGAIAREPADAHGRGRPRWLYRPSTPKASPYQALAEALSMQLSQIQDPTMAAGAAERWASALPVLPVASTPDAAVVVATDALNKLGFGAVANPLGDAISVTGCPYADLVDANPVICDIHTALVARLLLQTGQPITIESMDVWARPGMCIANLRRPDLAPARTITADERGIITSNEGSSS